MSQKPEAEETPPATLVFSGGTRETLELDAHSFLYAESEGNYVRLHYLSHNDNRPVSKLLRLTMKQAEASVALPPAGGCTEEVPVSRGYAKEIKERLFVR